MQGDCLEKIKEIPDNSVDMVLCDLPYGTTHNKWDFKIPFDSLWEQYHRVCKEDSAVVLFSQMPFSAELYMSNPKEFRYDWIWIKNRPVGFLDANRKPLRSKESILVFYKKQPIFNLVNAIPCAKKNTRSSAGKNYGSAGQWNLQKYTNYPRDFLVFPKDIKIFHPTQKPIKLLEYLIRTYTNENNLILDNTMGSGSTGVACVNTNRNFIGIELDENYFEIARKRIEEAEKSKSD